MFSYRHAFHAGNHADVLKHAILLQIFDHYAQKDSPYTIIDTHTGAGLYDLEDEWAQTKGEFYDGLDKVIEADNPPPMVERYLDVIADLNPDGVARYYPGSPWLALMQLRSQDSFHGFELHPSEFQVLQENVKQLYPRPNKKVRLYAENGFEGLKRLLPPPSRRAVVVMDPSYEAKSDYRQVQHCLDEALKRFAQCCYVIWYPLVQRPEVQQLRRYLESQTCSWLHTSLSVKARSRNGVGLHGSGMFIVNPPWTLYQTLSEALPWLKSAMAQDDHAQSYLQQHQV